MKKLSMTDEEIAETVAKAMEQMNAEVALECLSSIRKEIVAVDEAEWQKTLPLFKLAFMAAQMYKKGVLYAFYVMNEYLKECEKEQEEHNATA